MFSKSCEYAIKIMIFIASHGKSDKWVGLDEIAKAIQSPRAFTAKILQQLAREGLLDSLRGRSGGFMLAKEKSIQLGDIVMAIDGEKLTKHCVLGFKDCSEEHPCPVHFKFKNMREYLSNTLLTTTMEELKEVMNEESVFLVEA